MNRDLAYTSSFGILPNMTREVRHITRDRKLTAEEVEYYRKLREQIAADLPELRELGRKLKARKKGLQDNEGADRG
jgi:hypothetical protein